MRVAQGDGHGLGVEFGTFGAGMGMVLGEEESRFFLSGGLEAVGFDGGHIDEGDMLVGGYLPEFGVITHVPLNVWLTIRAILPYIADCEREQDGGGLFGADVGDVLTDIPAIGMNGFGMAVRKGDVFGFLAEAFE